VLGLPAALSIGVGTMVGAGVFIFPGIAGAQAGPAAVLSFALGGLIALFVALCTAELATAMPASGGAYQFVSRAFGPLVASLVGIAQWLGLVFAGAFYLVGFGRYAQRCLVELGVSLDVSAAAIAVTVALALIVINLVGAERAGSFQTVIVVVLTSTLVLLFGYGVLRVAGLSGEPRWPTSIAPRGTMPVFTSAALVFTSYLGFVQIATVAGEVKAPARTLPRALVGSVVIATALYVVVMFVSASLLSIERLEALGETAVVEVARTLIGSTGALVILGAGLLATVSSANASVLSASRSVFALAKDGLVPGWLASVNERFSSPHATLLAVGLPLAALTLFDRLELLAGVASALHLAIYGLTCVALLVLRRRRPDWYEPKFRVPVGIVSGLLGALMSFGLLIWMERLSLLFGGAIVAAALLWYAAFGRSHRAER